MPAVLIDLVAAYVPWSVAFLTAGDPVDLFCWTAFSHHVDPHWLPAEIVSVRKKTVRIHIIGKGDDEWFFRQGENDRLAESATRVVRLQVGDCVRLLCKGRCRDSSEHLRHVRDWAHVAVVKTVSLHRLRSLRWKGHLEICEAVLSFAVIASDAGHLPVARKQRLVCQGAKDPRGFGPSEAYSTFIRLPSLPLSPVTPLTPPSP